MGVIITIAYAISGTYGKLARLLRENEIPGGISATYAILVVFDLFHPNGFPQVMNSLSTGAL